ncbi:MAG: MFS transporter [Phaeodactylibacter sp.]|nr:MFS transporter [Phaeodactylibacter sp.]
MIRTLKAFALHLPSLSVGLTFMTLSILFGSWLARLPEVQAALALSEGQLGLALLGLPLGALTLTPFAGWLMKHLHTGRAMTLSALLFCACLPIPAFAQSQWALMGGLFVVGLSNSFMNISMNAAAAAIEQQYRITIMSICHGMFSLGAMIGAGSAGLIAAADVPLKGHLITLALAMVGLQFLLRPIILNLPNSDSEGSSFALPPKALLGLVFIGFCIMIGEGAIADWSAIYLRNILEANPFVASLGYAGFSMAMAMGRFAGDGIKMRLGAARLVVIGSLLGAGGLALAILLPYPVTAVLGFTLVGFGFSSVVPVLFSAAAKTPGVAPGTGIAAVASSGVVGFLIGPPLIGGIAEHFGLGFGLGIVAALALVSAMVAKRVRI